MDGKIGRKQNKYLISYGQTGVTSDAINKTNDTGSVIWWSHRNYT